MVFKFTQNKNQKTNYEKRLIKKLDNFNNKVVFINGFNASGKTMLCPIISSINKVESVIFPYDIEWMASLLYTNDVTRHGFEEFIKQTCDHTIYCQMMARNSNFRPGDITSVLNMKFFMKYFKRLFNKGDNFIPQIIDKEKPILCFSATHLSFVVEEIFSALDDRCLYIETVRDPLYMFKQIKIFFEDVVNKNPKKFFTFTFNIKNENFPFFDIYNERENLTNYNNEDLNHKVVNYLEKICNFYFNMSFENINTGKSKLILLPFENFVTKPDLWISEILTFLGQEPDSKLKKELKKQRVPRKVLTEGYKRKVYERYGNNIISDKELKNISYDDADKIYKQEIKNYIGERDSEVFYKLLKISENYRAWIKKFDKFTF